MLVTCDVSSWQVEEYGGTWRPLEIKQRYDTNKRSSAVNVKGGKLHNSASIPLDSWYYLMSI